VRAGCVRTGESDQPAGVDFPAPRPGRRRGRQPGQQYSGEGAGAGAEAMKHSVKLSVLFLAAALPLLALTARAADEVAPLGPQELVTKVAQDTLRDLDAHRSEYKQNR